MTGRKKYILGVMALLMIIGAAGCVAPFRKDVRERVDKKAPIGQVLADPNSYKGEVVYIGGRIIETMPKGDTTDIIVLQLPLGLDYSPDYTYESGGRFILVAKGFLDPAVYSKGRGITVAGEVIGSETRNIGQKPYTYAVLKPLEIKLWMPMVAYNYPPFYIDPFWGPFWGPPFGGAFWWGPPPPPHHRHEGPHGGPHRR